MKSKYQFEDMFYGGILTGTSQAKMDSKGPVNYITHHEVYKSVSLTNPVGVVSKSSFSNGSNLNNLTMKRFNTLANIFDNFLFGIASSSRPAAPSVIFVQKIFVQGFFISPDQISNPVTIDYC